MCGKMTVAALVRKHDALAVRATAGIKVQAAGVLLPGLA
jgi:hypothetical protein